MVKVYTTYKEDLIKKLKKKLTKREQHDIHKIVSFRNNFLIYINKKGQKRWKNLDKRREMFVNKTRKVM